MSNSVVLQEFIDTIFKMLEETFEKVHGIYLDRGTSLFETLADITAEEASRPVSARCSSLAGQVAHICFYLDVLSEYMQSNPVGSVDWQESWQLQHVTPEEWEALKATLRATYERVTTLMKGFDTWEGEDEIGGAMAIVVHTAYHLGEIRQALCTLRG